MNTLCRTFRFDKCKFKPIDPRTEEEKLLDELMNLGCDQQMAESIVFSDKFTITLNKVGE